MTSGAAAVLLANPNAGRVDDAAIGAVAAAVGNDLSLEVAVTPTVDDVPAVLDRLDGRPLWAMGGDGTLNVAVTALDERDLLGEVVLGLIPAGTANAYARAGGIPRDVGAAGRRAASGHPRVQDLLVSDAGPLAVNGLHTGLSLPATATSTRLKRLFKQHAYPVANAIEGIRSEGWSIRVSVDGHELVGEDERVLVVLVGNTEYIGGGWPLWPGARPDDGLLDVVVLLDAGRTARPGLANALRTGTHLDRDDVRSCQATDVRVHGDVPGYNCDGEVHDQTGPTTWRVRPDAWSLLL